MRHLSNLRRLEVDNFWTSFELPGEIARIRDLDNSRWEMLGLQVKLGYLRDWFDDFAGPLM